MGKFGDAKTPAATAAAAGESRDTYRERVVRGSMVMEVERGAQQRPESCMKPDIDDQHQTLDETERESWSHGSFYVNGLNPWHQPKMEQT